MNLFNRSLRIFLFVSAVIGGAIAACAWLFSRLILSPSISLVGHPADSESSIKTLPVHFPANQDGLRVAGWFLPQQKGEQAPVMILIHGWSWNRIGEDRKDWIGRLIKAEKVDLLSLAYKFHQDGYAVLMYDMRNHGESANTAGGVTFGMTEALDLLGAINWLDCRSDVDMNRVGVTGFSMGANTAIFALSHTDQIKAVAAIQPTTPALFTHRMATYLAGPFGIPIVWLTNLFVKAFGGTALEDVDMVAAAAHTGKTPVLYFQGANDPFGSVGDVQAMAAVTPNLVDIIIVAEADSRYSGYTYAINNPEILLSYFSEYLNV
ncbi:MAG: dienelactone hydrolase [Candidatus Promineifilaceae bacterium]|jgi:dienelactone hydrolase